MFIYVLTFAFFALVLIAAFRSMGGDTVDDTAATAFLARMVGWVAQECAAVSELGQLRADTLPALGDGPEPLSERVHAGRKKLAGYQQQLQRFDVDEPTGGAQRVRVLLSTGIESLGWACRLAEGGSLERNPGVRTAVAELFAHASECVDEAQGIELGDVRGLAAPVSS